MIRTNAALNEALKACKGGEKLTLRIYEPIRLDNFNFTTPVTLTGSVTCSKLPLYYSPGFYISRCSGFNFEKLKLKGTKNGDGFNGYGIRLDNSSKFLFKNSIISQFNRGLTVSNCTEIDFFGNDFIQIQSDAVDLTGCKKIRFDHNYYNDFRPTKPVYDSNGKMIKDGDHPDCIQAFSNNASDDCEDIIIRNECVNMTPDKAGQGFWLSDARFGGHRKVVIEDNLLCSTFWHCIAPVACTGAVVRRNTILQVQGSPYRPWFNCPADARVEENKGPYYQPNNNPPAGNAIIPAVTQAEIDAAVADWKRKFR